jgi:GNAT superfamily N-acetyltransferase
MPEPSARVQQVAVDELGCWVAEAQPNREIAGVVALHRAGYGPEMPAGVAVFDDWRDSDDVVELRRLRVAPAYRRQGVATALSRTAIGWSRENEMRLIVLNTTSAQLPALNLYHGLGFREVCRSFVGRYELVWLALRL